MPFLKERVPLSHTWLVPSRLLSFEAVMERSQETVKDYRRRGRWERRGKRKRESPLFAPSHFAPARASSRRIPRLYLNNSVWTFSFIFLFLLAPEEGLFSNRNIGQFVEYIFFVLLFCLLLHSLWTGLWSSGELGRGESEKAPILAIFFPNREPVLHGFAVRISLPFHIFLQV